MRNSYTVAHAELLTPGGDVMYESDVVLDIVDLLRRRGEILAYLVEGSRDKRALADELNIPRSTLDRAVRELEAVDLVTYRGGTYTVTTVGEHLAHRFSTFLERIESILELEPFLRWVPVDDLEFDPRLLADAELLVPGRANPYAMIDRHVKRLANVDHVRGILPATGLRAHETAHERIVEHGAEAELIVEPGVADVMLSDPSFVELTEEMVETGRFDLFVYEGTIPYFVGLFDDETVQIGVDEAGDPRAILETDRREVRVWAHETIGDYRQQARILPQLTRGDPLSA